MSGNIRAEKEAVCLDRCSSYQAAELAAVVARQLYALGVDQAIKPGMQVVIKPNLVIRSGPEEAIITHPHVVAAVGCFVQKCGGDVLIAESPGGKYTPAAMKALFAGCGYTEMAEANGFLLYTACESKQVSLPEAKICHNIFVVSPFLEADYIIDIAKLKTHGMMGLSGAVKNLFGTVPGLKKPELHCRFPNKEDFADMLLDLCQFTSPDLCIIDAVDTMEGNGPTGGSKRFVGAVLASKSPYAADLAAAKLIGLKPVELWTVQQSIVRGLLQNPDNLQILGDSIEDLAVTGFLPARSSSVDFVDRAPKLLRPLLKKLATPLPRVRKSLCIGCGKCAESCPQKVIDLKNGKADIRTKGCIHCFCCHEMCPLHVIDIKRFGVFNL